jgi:hypothetical protein
MLMISWKKRLRIMTFTRTWIGWRIGSTCVVLAAGVVLSSELECGAREDALLLVDIPVLGFKPTYMVEPIACFSGVLHFSFSDCRTCIASQQTGTTR